MNIHEEWRDINGYESLYQVSSLGRIKSLPKLVNAGGGRTALRPEKILRHNINHRGYHLVSLYKNGIPKKISVHKLVAKAFLPSEKHGEQVNHTDGDKNNNAAVNLEMVSASENQKHAFSTGLNVSPSGVKARNFKGTIIATSLKSGDVIIMSGSRQIQDAGFYPGDVYKCLSGKIKTVKGYAFSRLAVGGSNESYQQ